jgi:predicted ATPase
MPRGPKRRQPPFDDGFGFLRSVRLLRDDVPSFDAYPFGIPAIRALEELELHRKVTFLVGENGSGKSTLIEAIAVASGFNAEGGSKNYFFATRPSESVLSRYLRLSRGARRERDGFFLRAESLFNAATYLEGIGVNMASYGGRSLHEQSHGESFLALAGNRFGRDGLYLLDEPEAALSPSRQLALLKIVDELVQRGGCQFLVATHSPILMAYPDATIYLLGPAGMAAVAYEDTEHYQITRSFLNDRESYLRHLLKA